ncbi:MAG: DUF1559 domain-containing protein [Capsulimonadaceae bacterium]|nr:DUF1559 domain-containing protein [Capsulimonadaceae bacterium]
MNQDRAFTLIELLVVIAIIAILAAILFPVFATAREKARQSTCASNFKQLGIAFTQYSQDYDETFPIDTIGVSSTWTGWDLLISPYAGLKATFVQSNTTALPTSPFYLCPDDQLSRYNNGTTLATARTYSLAATIYDGGFAHACWNATSGGTCAYSTGGGWLYPGRQTSEIPSPAATFMVVEMPNINNILGTSDFAWCYGPFNISEPGGGVNSSYTQDCAGHKATNSGTCSSAGDLQAPMHSGGWEYLYCDGHVKWLRPEQTFGTPGKAPEGHSLNGYNTMGWCNGTAGSPCGPWTLDDNDN